MNWEAIATLVGVAIQIVFILLGGVWAVGRIDTATQVLKESMSHLSKAIDELHIWLSKVENTSIDTRERVAKIEQRLDNKK